MTEVITAIALLCQVNGNYQGAVYSKVKEDQVKCQKKLAECVYASDRTFGRALGECVIKGGY